MAFILEAYYYANTSPLHFYLSGDDRAFDLLYCVAFMIMDKQWLEKKASYMEFNVTWYFSSISASHFPIILPGL